MSKAAYPLKLPASLKATAERMAREDGVSLNQWIITAVAQKVGTAEATAEFFKRRAGGATGQGLTRFVARAPDVPPMEGDELEPNTAEPAVPKQRSVTPDYITCLECGRRFKSLKRHLRTDHAMTPEAYRAKWGLEPGYPIVAPTYAASRSELAKKMGLGGARAHAGGTPPMRKMRTSRRGA